MGKETERELVCARLSQKPMQHNKNLIQENNRMNGLYVVPFCCYFGSHTELTIFVFAL